jgi:hypothetical protein
MASILIVLIGYLTYRYAKSGRPTLRAKLIVAGLVCMSYLAFTRVSLYLGLALLLGTGVFILLYLKAIDEYD